MICRRRYGNSGSRSQLVRVDGMGECHRLFGLVAHSGELRCEVIGDSRDHGGQHHGRCHTDHQRYFVGPPRENVRHRAAFFGLPWIRADSFGRFIPPIGLISEPTSVVFCGSIDSSSTGTTAVSLQPPPKRPCSMQKTQTASGGMEKPTTAISTGTDRSTPL